MVKGSGAGPLDASPTPRRIASAGMPGFVIIDLEQQNC
jgi:hypothetical protein